MTALELFKLITSEPKWYAGYVTPQHASMIKKRFYDKELSFRKLTHMFNHYGYFLESSWDKKK